MQGTRRLGCQDRALSGHLLFHYRMCAYTLCFDPAVSVQSPMGPRPPKWIPQWENMIRHFVKISQKYIFLFCEIKMALSSHQLVEIASGTSLVCGFHHHIAHKNPHQDALCKDVLPSRSLS